MSLELKEKGWVKLSEFLLPEEEKFISGIDRKRETGKLAHDSFTATPDPQPQDLQPPQQFVMQPVSSHS